MDFDNFLDCIILLDEIRDCLYQLKYYDFHILDPKTIIHDDLKKIEVILGGF